MRVQLGFAAFEQNPIPAVLTDENALIHGSDLSPLTASVGVSHSVDFPTACDLVTHADAAMYGAKNRER